MFLKLRFRKRFIFSSGVKQYVQAANKCYIFLKLNSDELKDKKLEYDTG